MPNKKFDTIVLTVAHNEFKTLNFKSFRKEASVLYDVQGTLNEDVDAKL